jgi:single-stranded-DNA-specific exonuclease
MALCSSTSWHLTARQPQLEALLAVRLNLHPLAAAALIASGVSNPEEAQGYLSGSLADLPNPLRIRGMEEAVEIVGAALADRQDILVHGDYDADGICATAILVHALHRCGARVHYYLPDRFTESYGVSARAVRSAAHHGIPLIITVDCGITAHAEVALAKSLGCRVVVIDHHQPGLQLPPADAVVAPRRHDWQYECSDLPAAALALRFVQALGQRLQPCPVEAEEVVELAALGVIADVAPLQGENRIIARAGLTRLPHTPSPGLRALQEIAAVRPPIRGVDVAYRLVPRLNAAGRLADAGDALDMLLTNDEDEARRLALYLDQQNRQRQRLQDAVYNRAVEMIAAQPELLEQPVLVLSAPNWHVGVVGIVASKLVEDFARPVVLLVEEGETARGSARSVAGFDITAALGACAELLHTYGGHAMAAGLRLPTAQIPALRAQLCQQATLAGMTAAAQLTPRLAIPVALDEIDETLPADLARLEPFGAGNPEPCFVASRLAVLEARTVGRDGAHLKLFLTDGRRTVEAIGYRMGNKLAPGTNQRVDICFVPELNEYWGQPQLQLRLLAWRPAQAAGQVLPA